MMTWIRGARDQSGTSTLEFVVVLPTLLLVLFGIVELSRAWLTLNVATTAAREGARTAVVASAAAFPGNAVSRMDSILASANLTCSTAPCATVTCSGSPCAADSMVTATVNVTFTTLVPVLLPMMNPINITQTATMRFEGDP